MIVSKLRVEFRTRHFDPDEPDRAEWICAVCDGILRSDGRRESVSFSATFGEDGERSSFRYRFAFFQEDRSVLEMEQTGDSDVRIRFGAGETAQAEYRAMGQVFLLEVRTHTVRTGPDELFVSYDTKDASGARTRHEMEIRYTSQ